MNILIFTDSLGLPREKPEYVAYEETWPYALKQHFPQANVFQISLGGASIDELFRQVAYYKVLNPDIVIIQAGIVDCAPRALKKVELQLLQNYTLLNRFVFPVVKNKTDFLRKKRNISYTSPEVFENYVKQFIKAFGQDNVYWVGIIPAVPAYEAKLNGITEAVTKYNTILKNTLKGNFIDTTNFPVSGIMSDYHHLSVEGHAWIFNKIGLKLSNQGN